MAPPPPLKVGHFGIGLDAYWPQFAGLKERLQGYVEEVGRMLGRPGVEVVSAGLVDSPDRARETGRLFRRSEVDLIFLQITTYALSSTVLPVVRRCGVPVIVLNLSPAAAIDYAAFNALNDRTRMTGEWLAQCSACPAPEIANVFRRAGIDFHLISGVIGEAAVWAEIDGWVEAARVAAAMAETRMGLMGHYYGGMLDVYTDLTLQAAAFGTHFEMIEVEELAARRRGATASAVKAKLKEIRSVFDLDPGCRAEDLAEAARTAAALDRLASEHRLGSMAYYHRGTGVTEAEAALSSIILGTSLLTSRGIPVAGEYEVKNAQAMKILDLFGAGGSFTEFYAMDYEADIVLMGHDGPGHLAMAEGRPKVRPLEVYHGKVGRGVSVEMKVKSGPVTLLSVLERPDGKLSLLCAEAESVPGPILQIGNTNSRYRFACGARAFIDRWTRQAPTHHCAIGVGHIAARIEKLGALLGLETVRVP